MFALSYWCILILISLFFRSPSKRLAYVIQPVSHAVYLYILRLFCQGPGAQTDGEPETFSTQKSTYSL